VIGVRAIVDESEVKKHVGKFTVTPILIRVWSQPKIVLCVKQRFGGIAYPHNAYREENTQGPKQLLCSRGARAHVGQFQFTTTHRDHHCR
jgi:hypothetical protein